jgi:hypothetical protein
LVKDTPADNMEIVKEKVRADKKLLIATNMDLTESEANAFWLVYEAYQAELGKLRDRESNLIDGFAANFGMISDDVAKNLLDDSLSIDSGYLTLRRSYFAKFREVLPYCSAIPTIPARRSTTWIWPGAEPRRWRIIYPRISNWVPTG